MIIYDKIACILRERNMQWKDLCDSGISVNMPAKFSHNRTMNTENIDRVCEYLHVQPSDIMEWISAEEYNANIKAINRDLLEIAEVKLQKDELIKLQFKAIRSLIDDCERLTTS